MPVRCKKMDGKHRIVGPDGNIEKNDSGTAVDGGGHDSAEACQKQAGAINAEIESSEDDTLECSDRKWDGTGIIPASALWFRDQGGLVEFKKDDQDLPCFELDAYTGAPMPHPFFGKVVISAEGIDLGEKKGDGRKIILREHERDRVVGFGYPVRHGHHIKIRRGSFSKVTKDGVEVAGLLAEGAPLECSVNIDSAQVVDLPKGESMAVNGRQIKGPAVVFTKSRLREVSICSLGMDAGTSAAIAAAAGERVEIEVHEYKEASMPEDVKVEEPVVDVDAVKAEALEAGKKEEQARFSALVEEFGQNFAVEMFSAGKSLEEARVEDYRRLKIKCAELEARLEAAPVAVEGRALPVETGVKPDEDRPQDLQAAARKIRAERNANGENLSLGAAMKIAMKQFGFKDAREVK